MGQQFTSQLTLESPYRQVSPVLRCNKGRILLKIPIKGQSSVCWIFNQLSINSGWKHGWINIQQRSGSNTMNQATYNSSPEKKTCLFTKVQQLSKVYGNTNSFISKLEDDKSWHLIIDKRMNFNIIASTLTIDESIWDHKPCWPERIYYWPRFLIINFSIYGFWKL